MTLDEVMDYEKRIAETCDTPCHVGCDCELCREEKKQLVSYLEELKEYKLKEFQCHLAQQEGIGIGYKKDVDRFLEESLKLFAEFDLKHGYPTIGDCKDILTEVADRFFIV